MKAVPGHFGLYLSGTIYHFRILVPKELRSHFDGRSEIKKSLKTSDLTIAKRVAFELREDLLVRFQRLRGPKYLTEIEARVLMVEVEPEGDGLEMLIDYWKEQAPRSKKTLLAVKQAARLWGEKFPSVGPTETTRQEVLAFRDHLLKERDPRTVSKLLALLATVFQTACDGGRLEKNPFARIRVVLPRFPVKPRLPFTDNQIKTILDALPSLDTDMRWITLIGLYTGCRIAEITQLRRQDVRTQNGITYIEVSPEAGPLKTRGSARRVPVHPGLIAWGFDEWVVSRRDLLFDIDDAAASKRFGRFLDRIGLADEKLVFHSFRHSFKERCREAGIHEEVHDALTGHSNGSVGRGYGGVPLKTLAEAVARLRFPVPLVEEAVEPQVPEAMTLT